MKIPGKWFSEVIAKGYNQEGVMNSYRHFFRGKMEYWRHNELWGWMFKPKEKVNES